MSVEARTPRRELDLHDRHIPELRADYDRRLEREGLSERVLSDWV